MTTSNITNSTPPLLPVKSDYNNGNNNQPAVAGTSAGSPQSGTSNGPGDVKAAAVQANSLLQASNRSLEFQVDDSTKEVVVKIVDNQTGQTLKQIPTQDMLDFIKRMQQLESKKGNLTQEQA
jgi:uncharacterized FlaG/YvyC family protein